METHGDDSVRQRTNSMATLAEELIMEILLRLPVKSLLRFRCVSKSWLSLISSPHFAKAHLLLSATNKDYTHHRLMLNADDANCINYDFKNQYFKNCSLSSLLCDSVTEAFDLDYPRKNASGLILQRPVVGLYNMLVYASCSPRIVGSFNGLVCLSLWAGGDELYFFLWNPSIRKFKTLPGCGFNCNDGEFDYSRFGFAYDVSQDDYKVVCILPVFSPTYINHVKTYSLKSNSWKSIDGLHGSSLLAAPGKLVNGKLHWCDIKQNIISLDLADEKWAEVVTPQFKLDMNVISLELGVFGSDLSAMCNHGDGLGVIVDAWVMKEYGVKESWTKMFRIEFLHPRYIISPIFMSNEGEILLQHGPYLAKYNPKDNSIKYPNMTNTLLYRKAESYVKSLVCPF